MLEARLRSGRQYWVRADVRCLMCGRRLGHLLGPTEPPASPPPSAGPRLVFAMFRASGPGSPVCRVVPGVRFRCATCGGQGMIDEMQTFAIQNQASTADEEASASTPSPVKLRLLK